MVKALTKTGTAAALVACANNSRIFNTGECMSQQSRENQHTKQKAAVTLSGTVEKIIPPVAPGEPETAQISLEGAEVLYREIRVENTFRDATGSPVALKTDAQVEVTIAAVSELTTVQLNRGDYVKLTNVGAADVGVVWEIDAKNNASIQGYWWNDGHRSARYYEPQELSLVSPTEIPDYAMTLRGSLGL